MMHSLAARLLYLPGSAIVTPGGARMAPERWLSAPAAPPPIERGQPGGGALVMPDKPKRVLQSALLAAAQTPETGLRLKTAIMTFAFRTEFEPLARKAQGSLAYRAEIPDDANGALTQEERREWARIKSRLTSFLLTRLKAGQVEARGFVQGAASSSVTISAEWWRDAVVNLDEGSAEAHGVKYSGVMVAWPAARPVEPAPAPAVPARSKAKGGRPTQHDWKPFATEMMRLLALDGGNMSRTELKRSMLNWCALKYEEPAANRTIEKMVDELLPPDILPD